MLKTVLQSNFNEFACFRILNVDYTQLENLDFFLVLKPICLLFIVQGFPLPIFMCFDSSIHNWVDSVIYFFTDS